eukprot:Polyplicarium_translucidae@DN3274_c18_g6_i4.p2
MEGHGSGTLARSLRKRTALLSRAASYRIPMYCIPYHTVSQCTAGRIVPCPDVLYANVRMRYDTQTSSANRMPLARLEGPVGTWEARLRLTASADDAQVAKDSQRVLHGTDATHHCTTLDTKFTRSRSNERRP